MFLIFISYLYHKSIAMYLVMLILVSKLSLSDAWFRRPNQPLRVVNAYNDSLDLEWDFQSNLTNYMLLIKEVDTASAITASSIHNNEMSIKNLSAGGEYEIILFGSMEKSCNLFGAMKKVVKLLSDKKLHQTLPRNFPRQTIQQFEYNIAYIPSLDSFMVTLQWQSFSPDVSEYRLRLMRTKDCLPNQKELFTINTSLTTLLLSGNEVNLNESLATEYTFHISLRVFSYKMVRTLKKDFFPKAEDIQLQITRELLKTIKQKELNAGIASVETQSDNVALIVGLSVTCFCIIVLIGCIYHDHKRGKCNWQSIKEVLRYATKCDRSIRKNDVENNNTESREETTTMTMNETPTSHASTLHGPQTRINTIDNVYSFC